MTSQNQVPEFYVYENWRRKRGRIHLATCPYCNHGRGTQAVDSGENGRWHGPYQGRNAAFEAVEKLQTRADIQPCMICQP